jgi:hypothetical protein
MTTRDFFSEADTVVMAEVLSAQLEHEDQYKATYEVLEQFKGIEISEGVATYSREVHSILLTPGKNYIFFFKENNYVSTCKGSRELGRLMAPIRELRELANESS